MNILLADDHALFRVGMEMIVNSTLTDPHLVFAEDWKEVHRHLQRQSFDIAFLDLFMPRKRLWQEELAQCLQYAPNLSICIVTSSSVQSHMKTALEIGVKGFVCKTAGIREIKKALLNILQGKVYLPNVSGDKTDIGLAKITQRQKEVLLLLSKGKSNKEIGLRLGIAETTVKRHLYDIYQLLGINNRVKAGLFAKEQGLFAH